MARKGKCPHCGNPASAAPGCTCPADKRLHDLRRSGYQGPVDHDGNAKATKQKKEGK